MKHFLSFLFVLLLSVRVLAQEGGLVSGTVKDATGMTLPGAVLKLDRFNRYTVSDNNGYFEFLNVPAGSYRVEVEYLGYEPAVLEATVTAGGQALHILTIGGRQYELSLRDTAAGFRLTGADRDSLYLEREGTVYGVKRCDE